MSLSLEQVLNARLAERQTLNRYRTRATVQSPQGSEIVVDGQSLIGFCSNDYLGLANHPHVIDAFQKAAVQYGAGSGASHLVCGHSSEHHALEEELAAWMGRERCLLFSTGYMANLGVVNALMGRGDAVFEDRLNHASLLDAGLLSSARFHRFHHNDMAHLHRQLRASDARHKMIVVDGVFSMDGDLAPLADLSRIAEEHDAWLMVDDAHGLGCLGKTGAGSAEYWGLSQQQVPIVMGTLGKAFGSFGAFVAGSEALIEALIQFARPYIYTTALPPAVAAATRAALKIVQQEPERRLHLQARIQQFRVGAQQLGLQLWPSDTAIQPIIIGADGHALNLANALKKRGYWVSAIRPPTVPEGTARLRVTLSATHTAEHVEGLLAALADSLAEMSEVEMPAIDSSKTAITPQEASNEP